jgi:hypothetical protein
LVSGPSEERFDSAHDVDSSVNLGTIMTTSTVDAVTLAVPRA